MTEELPYTKLLKESIIKEIQKIPEPVNVPAEFLAGYKLATEQILKKIENYK